MVRIAKKIDLDKLEKLKKKIDDEDYMQAAVAAIAQALTKNLVRDK